MNYKAVLDEIKSKSDPKYKEFNDKLIPNMEDGFKSYGVRLPELKAMAKGLAKEEWEEFAAAAKGDSHEELMLWGFVIAYAKAPVTEKFYHLDRFVPAIPNWAVCDSVTAAIKPKAGELADFRAYIDKYLASEREYEKRFALVCLMDYYINDEYVSDTLKIFSETESSFYYVKMAAAWGLQACFVKYKDLTLEYFTQGRIKDPWVNNKSIQKIRESYKVSSEDKMTLAQYKKE